MVQRGKSRALCLGNLDATAGLLRLAGPILAKPYWPKASPENDGLYSRSPWQAVEHWAPLIRGPLAATAVVGRRPRGDRPSLPRASCLVEQRPQERGAVHLLWRRSPSGAGPSEAHPGTGTCAAAVMASRGCLRVGSSLVVFSRGERLPLVALERARGSVLKRHSHEGLTAARSGASANGLIRRAPRPLIGGMESPPGRDRLWRWPLGWRRSRWCCIQPADFCSSAVPQPTGSHWPGWSGSSRSCPGNPTSSVATLASEEAWSTGHPSPVPLSRSGVSLLFSRCGCPIETCVVANDRSGWWNYLDAFAGARQRSGPGAPQRPCPWQPLLADGGGIRHAQWAAGCATTAWDATKPRPRPLLRRTVAAGGESSCLTLESRRRAEPGSRSSSLRDAGPDLGAEKRRWCVAVAPAAARACWARSPGQPALEPTGRPRITTRATSAPPF